MQKQAINPWTWQDAYGYSQAVEISGGTRQLFCAGQTSVDDQGKPLHKDDMPRQLSQALDNLVAVLAKAGMGLENVVRLNYYTTDLAAYFAASGEIGKRFASLSVKPPGTLLQVASLFHPDIMIEIEATAIA